MSSTPLPTDLPRRRADRARQVADVLRRQVRSGQYDGGLPSETELVHEFATTRNTVRAAENLGAGYYSTQEAFDGWKKSSGHEANLSMPQATRIGIALAKNPQTRYGAWWTLVLAAEPEKRREMSAGPLVPARGSGTTTFRWGPSL